jgi:CelD/BcsL family acetyltransferase involved in cellulose biosynthesis
MRVDILTEPNCFDTLAQEWHELLKSAPVNHIFMTPEFQKTWWETLGSGTESALLYVVTIRNDQGQLVGLAPLYKFRNTEGKFQLSFIGCVDVSDYLDFIVHREYQEIVYAEIVKHLQAEAGNWQELSLCSIPEKSPTLQIFEREITALGWQRTQTQQDVCPVIELPATWEEYLEKIGKKQRHEVKRKWEKLFRETLAEFELITGDTAADKIEQAITDFISLHQKSSQEKKSFWNASHEQFFHQFAQVSARQKWLRLYFLKVDDRRVAAMLGFEYGNQFYLYNSGFDADEYYQFSVGNVLTAYTIQQAINTGNTLYDFLRGDEEYKFRFGAVSELIYDLKVER